MRRIVCLSGLVLALGLAALRGTERTDDWIHQRVRAIRESDNEDWRRIPWAASLSAAADAARKERRPLFAFSYEGNIDTGRC